jgi:hypothetical protein
MKSFIKMSRAYSYWFKRSKVRLAEQSSEENLVEVPKYQKSKLSCKWFVKGGRAAGPTATVNRTP